jgi:hypothetical protein
MMVVVVVVMMKMKKKKKDILQLQCTKFIKKLTVTKHVNKFPVHKSSSLPNLSLSLDNPSQNYRSIYTYIFIS